MFNHASVEDLHRLEGAAYPQLQIESELERIGGGGWDGFGFRVRVLKAVGYDVDFPPSDQVKIAAYNKVADILNSLPEPRTKIGFCKVLGFAL